MKKLALIAIICMVVASISVVQFNTVVYASPGSEYVKPTAFTDPNAVWTSQTSAYDLATPNDTTTYTTGLLDTDSYPSVTFSSWDTKWRPYTVTTLYVNWKTDGAWSNDTFDIQYTKNGGGLWSDLVAMGIHNETAIQTTSVSLDADQDLTQVQVQLNFERVLGADNADIYIYDIWTEGTYTPPTWNSYYDDYSTSCEDYNSTTSDTIFMKGAGFTTATYKVRYYDDFSAQVGTDADITVGVDGILTSSLACNTDPLAAAGLWSAKVYDGSTGTILIAEDTFTVQSDVIPEFPTIFAAIGVAGLCFGIYWWMKRRLVYVKA